MSEAIKWRTTEVKGEHPDYDITILEERKGYYRADCIHKNWYMHKSTWSTKISDLKRYAEDLINE